MNTLVAIKYRPFVSLVGLVLIGLLFFQFIRISDTTADNQPIAQKVNLALRRTAHHLLVKAGDSTSRIPPVQQTGPQTFQIQLGHNFNYGALPSLLQESFKLHQISADYDVAILDCQKGEVQLGYTIREVLKGQSVACQGRMQVNGCHNLQITFLQPKSAQQPVSRWWFLGAGSVLSILLVTFYRRSTQPISASQSNANPATAQPSTDSIKLDSSVTNSDWMPFGNSSLDHTNQLLVSGSSRHELTYREAKLLKLFVDHPNQVLERDFILKSVWEDEGIIVGRSADVFVSRLRKLLKDDPAIRIAAVHGVGYRMEVKTV